MARIGKSPPPTADRSTQTVGGLEALLSDWFDACVVLTSSGRAALLLLLQELGLSRHEHRVAIARYSTQCVVDAVSRAAFPVDAGETARADLTLFYHQYGFPQLARPPARAIEDICHSFFDAPARATKVQPEIPAIFSLPKFFSTNAMVGGVVTRDRNLADRIRNRRVAAAERSIAQIEIEAETYRRQGNPIELEQLYVSRLLNPCIADRELGGLPTRYASLAEAWRRRQYVCERLIAAAGSLNVVGWAEFVRDSTPYAFPLCADVDTLLRVDQAMKEIGVESDIYRIDIARNMFAPSHVPMLLIPYSHYTSDAVLDEMIVQLKVPRHFTRVASTR